MKAWCGRVFRAIFPPLRHSFRWQSLWPLILFALVFLATCWAIDRAQIVTFTHLWPFALFVLAPWVWWMWLGGASGLPRFRSHITLFMRLALLGLLIVSLAEPRAIRKDDRLAVVYAVDLSGSIAPVAGEQAMQYAARIGQSEKSARDLTSLVYFGRNAAVQIPPKAGVLPDEMQVIDVPVERDGSNLAQALSLSAAMIDEGQSGRIVLISDGVQTDGNLARVLEDLQSKGIAVDVLPIDYGYEEEVWVERLELPREVKEGETYEAAVLVSSLKAGKGKLILRENDQKIFEDEVTYSAGKNRFTLPIQLRKPGYYEYSVYLEPQTGDQIQENNVAIDYLFLKGQGRILLVTDPQGDQRDWESLAQALTNTDFVVEQTSPYDLPRNPLVLKTYDSVIFANIPRDELDSAQIETIHDAVYHHGVGFLMVGGAQSFGPGGWHQTSIEKLLPVDLDLTQRKVLLNGGLVLVLDQSGSMESPIPGSNANKQLLANKAAVAAIGTLTRHDWLGVIAFNTAATRIVPFGLNTNPEVAMQKVRAIGSGGGTDMYPALDQAVADLIGIPSGEAAVKHIILLTDGQSTGNSMEFIKKSVDNQISISTIGVGEPGDVNTQLLKAIASVTGGRFYPVNDAQLLPRVLIREAATLRKAAIRNETFTPNEVGLSAVMKGINTIPPLHGIVLAIPKDRAEVVLAAPPKNESEPADPLLSLYRYGVGRTAAWTSDFSTNWGKDMVPWPHFEAFLRQLFTEISQTTEDSHYALETYAAGNEGIVQIEDHAPNATFQDFQVLIQEPGEQSQTLRLKQVAPRRYEGRFPLKGEGRYQVTTLGNGTVGLSDGFVIPYSQEYLRFTANPLILKQIAEATGGRVLTGKETASEIYVPYRMAKPNSQSIVDWLLTLLAICIPLDVALRRIQLDFGVVRSWFRGYRAERSETMSVLLNRKQSATGTRSGEAAAKPLPQLSAPRPEASSTRTKQATEALKPTGVPAKPEPKIAPPPDGEKASTMEKLLAVKHRNKNK